MLKTYNATIIGDRIEWDEPDSPKLDQPAKVIVTVLNSPANKLPKPDAEGAAEILAEIAARGGLSVFGDPMEWQREIRKDRPLPGRDDE